MAASELSDLLEYMVEELPKCPQPLKLQQLRVAARMFCQDTEAWLEELTAMDVAAAQQTFTLRIDYDASVVRIVWVKLQDSLVSDLNYVLREGDKLYFEDAPSDTALTGALVVKVALVPDSDSDELPEWFLEKWKEGVLAYAKWCLMRQKRKPWYDPELAVEYRKEYSDKASQARCDIYDGGKLMRIQAARRNWV